MMSDSEEKLDDLHQSILSLCGADLTVIEVHNDSPRKAESQDKGSEESSALVPDIGKSPSKSESSTLYSCFEFDTVDETSCSDDMYTTTSEEMSGWSPPKSLRKSELLLMHTMDETDGDVTTLDGLKHSQINTLNKTENFGKGAMSYTPALGLSPIKDFEKDPGFLLSEPATPSFLDSGKFSKFVQSTPLHAALTKVAASNNLPVIKEQKIDRNENDSRNFAKSGSKKISMFQNDESELSNMDFDELLPDTSKFCKGSDDDWDKFFRDTKMLPRRSPSFDHEVNEEDREKQIEDKTSLKQRKMLYAIDNTQGQTAENRKTSSIYNTQMDESQLDTTIIAKNETLDSKKSEIHENMFVISEQQNKNETPDDNESRKDENSGAKETASDLKDSGVTADKNPTRSKDSNQNIPSTSKESNQNIPSTSKDSNQIIPSTSKCQDQSYIPDPSKGQEHNLSKINIDGFFSNELKSKEQGRFSNLTTSLLSDIDITEDEDVLGLNNFTYSEADDIELDDEDEATLLDEAITDLPESIKNKYKLQEQTVSILIQPDKTIDHNDQNKTVCEKEATIAPTDVNKNFMKTSDDNKERILDQIEKVDAEVKETEVKVTEEKRPEIEKVTSKIDYEAERKYFDIQSPEVRDIINQWESKGIQDPNTNLSFASNIRSKNHIKKRMLEGTHLPCRWLQESVEAKKNCSSPMKKRQKLDSEAHTRQDIMNLEQEFNEIQFRHQASLNGLLQEWEYEKENLEGRKKQLRCRQMMEMKENYYKDADLAKQDILAVFSQYKDLRPSHGPFIFNDGSRKDLVNLDGTIPINYRGNIFNIPIGIFLLDTHPYNSPIVYVKPTNTMVIKQGPNVDADGKVDMPYLHDWKYPDSNLLGLIQLLSIVFEEEPPVFARSASRPQIKQVSKPQYPNQEDAGHRSCESATDRRLLCSECSLNPLEVTIQPCGHLATCESCCRRLKKQHNQCPICNGPIDNVVRSFVPE